MTLNLTIFTTSPAVAIFGASKSVWLCSAGAVLFVIGILAVKSDFAQARGLDKIAVLANLCFAMPLAVFGTEHFTDIRSISQMVPSYIPWHLFWAYFVGLSLLAASLSIATKIQVQWSGLLFGIMMFSFDAMLTLPAVIGDPHNRFNWILLCREPSFGCGAWALSTTAANGWGPRPKITLLTIARVIIGIAAVFYGVEHFLHPANVPGVPLEKLMPAWIPAHTLISSLTGAMLLAGGVLILLAKSPRMGATYLGGWLVLIVLLVYGPILIASLLDPSADVQLEGINYFFDTLLYAGAVLALAKASPREA
jgi:uncharacterized membrane protein